MKIQEITSYLEKLANPSFQENYDNSGLILGDATRECSGIIISLDTTEEVILEAVSKNANLIISHHPIIFGGLKRITGKNYVERAVIAAIKNDIAIYAIHTNLDNVITGVNAGIADKLGLVNRRVIKAKEGILKKLFTYVPIEYLDKVREAIFDAGAGQIGDYKECSFNATGEGSFKASMGSNPFLGKKGERHYEKEQKLEMIFEGWKEKQIINALINSHPYEEVAYEIITLDNTSQDIGSGIIGELGMEMKEADFLRHIKNVFDLKILRHTPLLGKMVKKIAICGGAGSFLTKTAIAAGAHFFITSDLKYHEFFDADGHLILADIGHYESEQFTQDLLNEVLQQKFPTFAIQKTEVQTNPVKYWL